MGVLGDLKPVLEGLAKNATVTDRLAAAMERVADTQERVAAAQEEANEIARSKS